MIVTKKEATIGLLALSRIKGIGPTFIKKVQSKDMFLSSNISSEIRRILSSTKKEIYEDEIYNQIEKAKEILYRCNDQSIEIISIIDDDYPTQLKAIKDPPPVIFCKGNTELLHTRVICIIGTREPNDHGKIIAERVGNFFSTNRWSICNGLAEGVDSFAIKLNETLHSKIVGILAGGLNYNEKKTLLQSTAANAEAVLQNGGLLISEMDLDKREDSFSVIKSCRIQAGISNCLVLVQSSLDGGSKFATKAFSELSRPIAVIKPVQTDIDLPAYEANKELILNNKNGLAKFADINPEKIQTTEIFVINTKEDYSALEKLIRKQVNSVNETNSTLFD